MGAWFPVCIKFLDHFDEKLNDIEKETGTDYETLLEVLNLRITEVLQNRGYDQNYINKQPRIDVIEVYMLEQKSEFKAPTVLKVNHIRNAFDARGRKLH